MLQIKFFYCFLLLVLFVSLIFCSFCLILYLLFCSFIHSFFCSLISVVYSFVFPIFFNFFFVVYLLVFRMSSLLFSCLLSFVDTCIVFILFSTIIDWVSFSLMLSVSSLSAVSLVSVGVGWREQSCSGGWNDSRAGGSDAVGVSGGGGQGLDGESRGVQCHQTGLRSHQQVRGQRSHTEWTLYSTAVG